MMMMMTYPTIEDIQKEQDARLQRARDLLQTAKTEEEKKRLRAMIWRIQNS